MFIGREQELAFLENKYNQLGGQLVVLYGRRRIGKTETLREFCKGKDHVFYSCTETTDQVQLKNFSTRMWRENLPIKKYLNEFRDWEQAFQSIASLPYNNKKLLVIDEFPYMVKNNPSIPSILQNLWDEKLKDENVMIILCGSAMSFMEKEILGSKNPLYGRATGIYKMKEMSFYDAIQFFPNYSTYDKIIAYSILGGIPHYLKQFNPTLTIEDNIKQNILSKGSVLYNEVEFLLRQELRETSIYNSLIQAIAKGHTKLNEISHSALINDSVKTNVYLKNLIELGIVEREFSIDAGDKEITNSNRGFYKLTDSYFRFWYNFVFSNIGEVETGDIDGVYDYLIKPHLNEYTSFTFENICIQYLRKQQRENKLPFRYLKIGRWFGKTKMNVDGKLKMVESEIDILAYHDHQYIVGECKFQKSVFKYSDYLKTTEKLNHLKTKNEFYYYLFSLSGFDNKIINLQDEHLHLIGIDDIVG